MKLSLTQRLVVGGSLLVLIQLICVTTSAYRGASHSLQKSAEAHLIDRAADTAHGIDLMLDGELQRVATLARNNRLVQGVIAAADGISINQEELVREILAVTEELDDRYGGIFVTDAQGSALAGASSAGDPNFYNKLNVAARDYFKTAMSTGRPCLSDAIISLTLREPLVYAVAPILRKGAPLGVVVISFRIKSISDHVTAQHIGKTGYPLMLSRTGQIVTHPNQDYIMKLDLKEQEGMADLAKRMLDGETGTGNGRLHGIRLAAGFAPVKAAGWSVAFVQDETEFHAPARQLAITSLAIAMVLLLLAIASCIWFGWRIVRPLRQISSEMDNGGKIVNNSAQQVSRAAQQLARTASSEAASLEETSSAIEELSSMARQNVSHTTDVARFMAETRDLVQSANATMQKASQSMDGAAKASGQTAAIIKTIDAIAFQTNILALNAAVEAARAGGAGAGFAVVAEEVRALAGRSAEASRSSAQLLEATATRVNDAATQVGSCGTLLQSITANTQKIDRLVTEIAQASQEQNNGIAEINKAMSQMNHSVQDNAAQAEESSAASEELASQAQMMRASVSELSRLISGSASTPAPAAAAQTTPSAQDSLESA